MVILFNHNVLLYLKVIVYGANNSTNTGTVTKNVKHWVKVNTYAKIVMLIVLWLRMFKYARPFENAGTVYSPHKLHSN